MQEGEKIQLDSLEPAAIQFTLEHLQKSARQSGCFLPANFMYLYPQESWGLTLNGLYQQGVNVSPD